MLVQFVCTFLVLLLLLLFCFYLNCCCLLPFYLLLLLLPFYLLLLLLQPFYLLLLLLLLFVGFSGRLVKHAYDTLIKCCFTALCWVMTVCVVWLVLALLLLLLPYMICECLCAHGNPDTWTNINVWTSLFSSNMQAHICNWYSHDDRWVVCVSMCVCKDTCFHHRSYLVE